MLYTEHSTSRQLPGDQHVHYHVAGETGPRLLLLHGSGPGVSAWGNWGGLMEQFAAHFRVIAPDLPGYGDSWRPEVDNDASALAIDTILKVLQAEGMDTTGTEQLHVIGNSLGGFIASQLALDHPELVDRVITLGAGGFGLGLLSPTPPEGIKRLVEFTQDPTRQRLVAWMESMVGNREILTEAFIEQRWQAATAPGALEYTRDFYAAAMKRQGTGSIPPMLPRIEELQHRFLMLFGRDDRVTPLETALVPMRLLSRGELHVFPNAGHWVMLEQPEAFLGVVLEFLQRP